MHWLQSMGTPCTDIQPITDVAHGQTEATVWTTGPPLTAEGDNQSRALKVWQNIGNLAPDLCKSMSRRAILFSFRFMWQQGYRAAELSFSQPLPLEGLCRWSEVSWEKMFLLHALSKCQVRYLFAYRFRNIYFYVFLFRHIYTGLSSADICKMQ